MKNTFELFHSTSSNKNFKHGICINKSEVNKTQDYKKHKPMKNLKKKGKRQSVLHLAKIEMKFLFEQVTKPGSEQFQQSHAWSPVNKRESRTK